MGAAYGTAKAGVGVCSMGVMRPEVRLVPGSLFLFCFCFSGPTSSDRVTTRCCAAFRSRISILFILMYPHMLHPNSPAKSRLSLPHAVGYEVDHSLHYGWCYRYLRSHHCYSHRSGWYVSISRQNTPFPLPWESAQIFLLLFSAVVGLLASFPVRSK
jgi:hypothetical protein